jgi:hypothetical protein
MTLNIRTLCVKCHHAEYLILFFVMPNVIELHGIMLSVVMLNVIVLTVVEPSPRCTVSMDEPSSTFKIYLFFLFLTTVQAAIVKVK